MKRSGFTDLPLHGGRVPAWLHERMAKLGVAIVEVIIAEYGRAEVLRRLSDPFWFQSFGAVLGMDWHSSGITTSVMGALKKSINPISAQLGLHICGGRGRQSRRTPHELLNLADRHGYAGDYLVRCSKLSAKIDNTAIQDGFQLYLHSFILSAEGDWSIVQQGMNPEVGKARRYHWHSPSLTSFVDEPHASIYGPHQGSILNMVAHGAQPARQGVLDIVQEAPALMLKEVMHLQMPAHHDVRVSDIDLKRLGAMLFLAHERDLDGFEDLMLLEGLGPRTLQSLALVSEIIYGTPIRFSDPARFSFAHGGKDGHPFPVPLQVYDETISFLNQSVERARIDRTDKNQAFKKLFEISKRLEADFTPDSTKFDDLIAQERRQSKNYGGRTVFDDLADKKTQQAEAGTPDGQLSLFE